MNSEKYLFNPLEMIHLLLKRWWLLVLFMLLGGGAGYVFHSIKAPVYEARALFASSIDFSKTGDLTEMQEDMAVVLLGDVIKSTAVIEEVLLNANLESIDIDAEKFKNTSFLERSNQHWVLIIRNSDPDQAALVANIWADAAQKHLNSALSHSLTVREIEQELESLQSCLEVNGEDQSETGACGFTDLSQLQIEVDQTVARLQTEKELSMGLLPESSIALVNYAEATADPVLYGRNSAVLFGALAGLVLGLGLLYLRQS